MVVKKSSKNQIAIPKSVLERAGLGSQDVYFNVAYERGRIILTPLEFEEKIPKEALERFEAETLKRGPGDEVHGSMQKVIQSLHRKRRR